MAVVYLFGLLINGPPGASDAGGSTGARSDRWSSGLYLLVIGWCFAYFYPIYVGEKITYADVVRPHVAGRTLDLSVARSACLFFGCAGGPGSSPALASAFEAVAGDATRASRQDRRWARRVRQIRSLRGLWGTSGVRSRASLRRESA